MAGHKDEKTAELLMHLAAEYFSREGNRDSLITFTNAEMLDRGRRSNIYFTVLPTEREAQALEFVRRKRNDFRLFVMEKNLFGFMPQINFALDEGEKNRQKIDSLLSEHSVDTDESTG